MWGGSRLREPQAGDRFTTAAGRELGRIISVDPGKQLRGTTMGAFTCYALVPHEHGATRLLLKIVMRTGRVSLTRRASAAPMRW